MKGLQGLERPHDAQSWTQLTSQAYLLYISRFTPHHNLVFVQDHIFFPEKTPLWSHRLS